MIAKALFERAGRDAATATRKEEFVAQLVSYINTPGKMLQKDKTLQNEIYLFRGYSGSCRENAFFIFGCLLYALSRKPEL